LVEDLAYIDRIELFRLIARQRLLLNSFIVAEVPSCFTMELAEGDDGFQVLLARCSKLAITPGVCRRNTERNAHTPTV